jgi:hypothetical protein
LLAISNGGDFIYGKKESKEKEEEISLIPKNDHLLDKNPTLFDFYLICRVM